MMNAQLFTNQEAALLNADAYLRSAGLDEVISPRRLVQKVNLNTTFHTAVSYTHLTLPTTPYV